MGIHLRSCRKYSDVINPAGIWTQLVFQSRDFLPYVNVGLLANPRASADFPAETARELIDMRSQNTIAIRIPRSG